MAVNNGLRAEVIAPCLKMCLGPRTAEERAYYRAGNLSDAEGLLILGPLADYVQVRRDNNNPSRIRRCFILLGNLNGDFQV